MIVLENVTVGIDNSGVDGTFGLVLYGGNSKIQHLRSYTEEDRDSWRKALETASHSNIKAQIDILHRHLMKKKEAGPEDVTLYCDPALINIDVAPLLSCCFSCDNLSSDPTGRPLAVR